MNALAAILTGGFSESRWTDQEIGVALGRRISVILIKREIEPYGFISKYQAIDANGKKVKEVAQEIFLVLSRSEKTKYKFCDCLTNLLLTSLECIPVMQVGPHPPAPSPKMGEGGPDSKSLSRSGRGI